MSTASGGAAREVQPGRLAHFEDSADLDTAATLPRLPPRRRPARDDAARTGTTAREATLIPPAPAQQQPLNASQVDEELLPPRAEEARSAPEAAPRGRKGVKGPEDRVRPSNVHIPVALLEPLTATCKREGLSHGEVIIVAIENSHPRLRELIHPAATAGGQLFASRRSRASRAADGPLTPLNYRLRQGDFDTLDQLVEEFGASSRGHLITAALTHYFRDQL